MDAFEIAERLKDVEREKARLGRIDWYNRNAPGWWQNLKDMLADMVWGEDLDDYCMQWFGKSEVEMAEFLGLEKEDKPVEKELVRNDSTIAEQIMEKKRAKGMTPAEKQKAYRERRKGK